MEISVNEVESSVCLWEILVAMKLTYLSIDCCCLLCFDDEQTEEIILDLHHHCLKMKALEAQSSCYCKDCFDNDQPLLLPNFPHLIHSFTTDIAEVIFFSEKLNYLMYRFGHRHANTSWSWSIPDCNLQQLSIESSEISLSERFID